MKHLILGCGPAGIAAAKTIRKAKPDAEIVIAGDELESPYLRPLLPDFILGDMDEESVLDPQGKDLYDKRIRVFQGKRAARLDMGGRNVAFEDGTQEPYDRLLIATGGNPSVPAPLQRKSGAILSFDSLGDARKIRERAKVPGAAVVYGPGTTGSAFPSPMQARLRSCVRRIPSRSVIIPAGSCIAACGHSSALRRTEICVYETP